MDETDRQEFRDWVTARSGTLLRTATLLTGERAAAEDLLQTALAKTYLSWGRLRHRGAVDAYCRRVMVTTYAAWWRRRWRGEVPTGDLPEKPVAGGLDSVEIRLPLTAALARLPKRMRAVVVLRYVDDLPDAEIAAVLGCSAGTVRSQATRALAKLRADGALSDFAPSGGEQ